MKIGGGHGVFSTVKQQVPFFDDTFARGGEMNRTLCKEGTVGCALLEDQSCTCLEPSLNIIV
jgi:hypothetical protein